MGQDVLGLQADTQTGYVLGMITAHRSNTFIIYTFPA
jgi:hypothetical protein